MDLSDNELSGEIPAALGDLSVLYELDLSGNRLSGTIPSELTNLSGLEDYWSDVFTIGVPSEDSGLVYLYLSDNELIGEIPLGLGTLPNLQHLSLSGNRLTGEIPSELGDLSSLQRLYLSDNRLTGAIPSELGDLNDLEVVRLGGSNQLTGCIPDGLLHVPTGDLGTLGLRFCGGAAGPDRTAPAGTSASDRAVLVSLYEAMGGPDWANKDNWLTDAPMNEWYGVTTDDEGRVVVLDLSYNDLAGDIPPELGNLSGLIWLYIGGLWPRGGIPPELGNLTNLERLRLSDVSGRIPPELGNLSRLRNLEISGASGPIPPEFGNLSNLEELRIRGLRLAGEIPPELGRLSNLREVHSRTTSSAAPYRQSWGASPTWRCWTSSGINLLGRYRRNWAVSPSCAS